MRRQHGAFTLIELPAVSGREAEGFTLVELLVVIAIISLLVAMLAPSLSAAKLRARVIKAHAELHAVGTALEAYATEHQAYPPVRASCNRDMLGHENQLPVELSNSRYLPRGPSLPDGRRDNRRMVGMEDPFNPEHTYKYNAPGDLILNSSRIAAGNALWVPDAFPGDDRDGPLDDTSDGRRYNDPAKCPVRWVIWSLGPQPASSMSNCSRSPISRRSWYRGGRDGAGVICRITARDGQVVKSP